MWEGQPEPELVWSVLALAVVIASAVAALIWRPFRASLTPQQLSGLAKLSRVENDSRGIEALKSYYDWRQDQLGTLARGFGGFGVAILLAVLAAMFEADKTVVERSGTTTTTTTTTTETSVAALVLVGTSVALAAGAWLRQRSLQREFTEDTRRLTWLVP